MKINRRETLAVLGACGAKTKEFGTTSFLLNKTTVVDAGNLFNSLEEKSVEIDKIWLTHSHLDHIVDIAYVLDNYFHLRKKTLSIMGLPETIKAVKENFLNNIVWPDFSAIKLYGKEEMAVKYQEIKTGISYKLSEFETITPFLTDHTVVSCGYIYEVKNSSSIMIATDTCSLKNIKHIIESNLQIKSLIIECSFPNEMEELAIMTKHLTPTLLFGQLQDIKRDDFSLYIHHLKPSFEEKIICQIKKEGAKWRPKILKDGNFIVF